MQDQQLSAAPGAPGFTKDFLGNYDSWKAEQIAAAPDDDSRRYLDQHLTQLRTSFGEKAIAFEGQQKVKWREDTFANATQNAADAAFNDPSQRDKLLNDILTPLDAMDMPGEWKAQQARAATQKVNLAAALSVAQSNPGAIVGQPGTGATAAAGGTFAGGFAGADAWIAQKEGGYVGNDNGKGPTNYGINSTANPDLDVSKLTPETASAVRKSRYWDAIHGDALPPAMQPVAYNLAMSSGPGVANRLIAAANGDPDKLNQLAKNYFDQIPPERANGNTPGWKARSDEALALGKSTAASADNPVLSSLNYQTRIQVFNAAKTQQNQDMALWRARISGRLQDTQAMATQGISDPTPLTMDTLLKAFPPDEAAQHYQAYQDGQQLALDVANIKGMPNDQIAGLVQSRSPMAGPGYAQAQRDQQILAQAAAHVVQQRQADPSAYVAQNAPAVQAAQRQFASNPTPATAQVYAQTSIAEQQRLGIDKPQILTKMQATSLEAQIRDKGGANADQVIQQQAQLWGPNWGTVFGQLKDIPPVAKVLGYLGDSVDASTRTQIMTASQVKVDELKDGLPTSDVSAAEKNLQSLTKDFASTMAYTVGGAQTFGALYDSAQRLTYTYMRQGMSYGDASQQAFQNIMGKNFNVVGNARIPSQYDQKAVMRGASGLMDGLDKADLVTPPAPATMRAEDAKGLYVSNLKSNGKWITGADGKGLILFDPVSQTVVRTQDGKPVGASWSDLVNPPAPTPAGWSAFGPDAGSVKGMVSPGNIDLTRRPQVKNDDGSISTVRSMSFEEDGKEVLIPTVSDDGKRILSDDEAIAQYHRTGKYLGKFDTPDNADAYAEQLHQQQEEAYLKRGAGQYAPDMQPWLAPG
ncbi:MULTISPECIES: glycosyl hydrolase 108 family protein [unclassified Achromobacter]|uniref:glycosyl hydrolase 108 family protein n=1 Tax=unclassified Achromobacter TaxID=2626865 RepID=UPI001303D5E8|nr:MULTISPECIES: glycosyl hydrolase 108 family protein [unclassified Achromobacter]